MKNANGNVFILSVLLFSTLANLVLVQDAEAYPCATFIDQTQPHLVFGWGANSYGELGLGNGDIDNKECPTPLLDSPDFSYDSVDISAVAAGFDFSLAIVGGAVYAWGNNTFGQLGVGSSETPQQTNYTLPTRVEGFDSSIIAIAAGGYHSVALDAEGRVWTWGRNDFGQLGLGPDYDADPIVPKPTLVPDFTLSGGPVALIAAGLLHTLAADQTNIYAWGSNEFGQLGNNSYSESHVPILVAFRGVEYKINQLAAGSDHSLALVLTMNESDAWNAGVLGWGRNDVGQLGLGSNNNTLDEKTPQLIDYFSSLGNPIPLTIASGYCHSMVIAQYGADKQLYTFGCNNDGQLGLDSNESSQDIPHPILGIFNIEQAATGLGNHTVFSTGAYEVFAAGSNQFGQLGTGDNQQQKLSSVSRHVCKR
eukprot:TRINITY_DN284_c1_g3_i1.p1 TRINITY_DN284_c1_g3~~TRINITY_DN284_c1_g3_i1.p1  ORF type:complete len:422 (-),score=56.51 TRINITY_DN284_c1_g3_i1:964-2229(-)